MIRNILYMAIDARGISVTVRAANSSVLVALLLSILAIAAVILSLEIKRKRLGHSKWSRFILLLLNVLLTLLLLLLVLWLLNYWRRPWGSRGCWRMVPVGLGRLVRRCLRGGRLNLLGRIEILLRLFDSASLLLLLAKAREGFPDRLLRVASLHCWSRAQKVTRRRR